MVFTTPSTAATMPSAGIASAMVWRAAARACSSAWCLRSCRCMHSSTWNGSSMLIVIIRSVSAMKSSAKWSFWIFGNLPKSVLWPGLSTCGSSASTPRVFSSLTIRYMSDSRSL